MDHNIYLLATDPKNPCRDVIHSRDTGLKVKVFCVHDESFIGDANEIQLYGYVKDKLYAFETVNINSEDALDIDYPELEILPEDPRQGHHVAI